ncbi:MAG: NAD(P)H-dependent oxidoreductase [Balneolaceae bacterium]
MSKIEIISGSARPERQSHQVALYLQGILNKNENISAEILDVMEFNFPLLDYTFSNHPSPPERMKTFSHRLQNTDAILVVSPEHNGSYSGALKNTMDYFYKEYDGKFFGIVTVSNGSLGGISAMKNLQQYCLTLRGHVSPRGLLTPRVQDLFKNGNLIDENYRNRANRFVHSFLEFIT